MSQFHLVNEDEDFKSRSGDVFSQLDSVKNNLQRNKETLKRKVPDTTVEDSALQRDNVMPGYKSEPQKWTKYALDDISSGDDRENTRAALSFLHELKKRPKTSVNECDKVEEKMMIAEDDDKVNDDRSHSATGHSKNHAEVCFKKPSVHRMSEHVVGKSKSSHKLGMQLRSTKNPKANCDKIELEHLEENVSASEFQAEIAVKLEDNLKRNNLSMDSSDVPNNSIFRNISKRSKIQRNVRSRSNIDESVD